MATSDIDIVLGAEKNLCFQWSTWDFQKVRANSKVWAGHPLLLDFVEKMTVVYLRKNKQQTACP